MKELVGEVVFGGGPAGERSAADRRQHFGHRVVERLNLVDHDLATHTPHAPNDGMNGQTPASITHPAWAAALIVAAAVVVALIGCVMTFRDHG